MSPFFGKTVAVLDDEPMVIMILTEFFSEYGATVIQVDVNREVMTGDLNRVKTDLSAKLQSLKDKIDFCVFSASDLSSVTLYNALTRQLKSHHPELQIYLMSNKVSPSDQGLYSAIFTRPFDPALVVNKIADDFKLES